MAFAFRCVVPFCPSAVPLEFVDGSIGILSFLKQYALKAGSPSIDAFFIPHTNASILLPKISGVRHTIYRSSPRCCLLHLWNPLAGWIVGTLGIVSSAPFCFVSSSLVLGVEKPEPLPGTNGCRHVHDRRSLRTTTAADGRQEYCRIIYQNESVQGTPRHGEALERR